MTVDGKKWFLLSAGQVHGPMTPEEAERLLPDAVEPLLWGRGLPEWMPPAEWRQAMSTLGAAVTEISQREEPHWKFRIDGREHGPFTYSDLIAALKHVDGYADVELTGEGLGGWREIYSVQKVVDELGITRRAHPRVPIMGSLKADSPRTGPFVAKVTTISEGGVGVNGAPSLSIGDRLKGVLSSPNLFMEIPCTCEVVYVGGDGYTGLRFVNLPSEAHASVIEYVKKFSGPQDRERSEI